MDNNTDKTQHSSGIVFAVASGKGGVGKTNLAANLAICIAKRGKRVMLFDADMGLANLDLVMNIRSRYNISHVLKGEKTIDDIIIDGPGGVEVICGANGLEKLADLTEFERERLLSELEKIQQKTDVLFIDTGAGIHKSVVGFCMASNAVIVVATPEPTSMTDAYAMIKVLAGNKYQGRICMIVNMAESNSEGRKVYRQISDVAKKFLNVEVYDGGVVLRDDRFSAAVRSRQPLVLHSPKSRAAGSLESISSRLIRGYKPDKTKESFFRKVVNMFF